MFRFHRFVALVLLAADAPVAAAPETTLTLLPESPRWELAGEANVTEYLGRRCLELRGASAGVRELELRDATIDVEVATGAERAFFGIEFRADAAGRNSEVVYLRPHKSGLPDALQYTPVFNTGLNWQLYSGPGFTARAEVPRATWLHLRLAAAGAQAKLFLQDMEQPVLVVDDLKSGLERGGLGLFDLIGPTCIASVTVRATPDAPWERRPPPMPKGTITAWELSPAFETGERDLERPLTAAERTAMTWQAVVAEPPGLVVINRYRDSPHPRVTFARDPATRLDPQPGSKVVYARTRIQAERAEVRKLYLGYSDEVTVFLGDRVLYRGRSAQSFRDPGFLGIVDAENDAVWLPLVAGSNELVLAVNELGGGWGFVARLAEASR